MSSSVQSAIVGSGGFAAAGGTGQRTGSRITEETGLGREEFLKLLVAQLQYQDPMDPLDARSFVAELAQFANLEVMQRLDAGMVNLNRNFDGLVEDQAYGRALSLIGRMVGLADGTAGLVQRAALEAGGARLGLDNGYWVDVTDVTDVTEAIDITSTTDGPADGS